MASRMTYHQDYIDMCHTKQSSNYHSFDTQGCVQSQQLIFGLVESAFNPHALDDSLGICYIISLVPSEKSSSIPD